MRTTTMQVGAGWTQCSAGDGRSSDMDCAQRLRYALASAGGSWGREFRRLLLLAEARQMRLNTEALAYYDVRDLQALQRRLEAA